MLRQVDSVQHLGKSSSSILLGGIEDVICVFLGCDAM
jgi:hypothetical protein